MSHLPAREGSGQVARGQRVGEVARGLARDGRSGVAVGSQEGGVGAEVHTARQPWGRASARVAGDRRGEAYSGYFSARLRTVVRLRAVMRVPAAFSSFVMVSFELPIPSCASQYSSRPCRWNSSVGVA